MKSINNSKWLRLGICHPVVPKFWKWLWSRRHFSETLENRIFSAKTYLIDLSRPSSNGSKSEKWECLVHLPKWTCKDSTDLLEIPELLWLQLQNIIVFTHFGEFTAKISRSSTNLSLFKTSGTCSAAFRAEAKRSLRPASDAWNVSGTITRGRGRWDANKNRDWRPWNHWRNVFLDKSHWFIIFHWFIITGYNSISFSDNHWKGFRLEVTVNQWCLNFLIIL